MAKGLRITITQDANNSLLWHVRSPDAPHVTTPGCGSVPEALLEFGYALVKAPGVNIVDLPAPTEGDAP